MADIKNAVELTPQELKELLTSAVTAAVKEAVKPTPLEAKKYKEEMEKEERKRLLSIALAKAEEESMNRKRRGCTHYRHSQKGHPLAPGNPNGEWTTGGQALQDGTAFLLCVRCATGWRFKPSPEQYTFILQNGMSGWQPPQAKDVIAA